MATREELKVQVYDVLYEEEYALLSKTAKAFDAEPDIRHTGRFVKKNNAIIPDTVTAKLFPESMEHRMGPAIVGIIACAFIVWFIFFNGPHVPVWIRILGVVFFLVATGILIARVMKADPEIYIEVSSAGVGWNGYSFTWQQILDTYIVKRPGRNAPAELVLLLDNGSIFRESLRNYKTASSIWAPQHDELCFYIEHFKGKMVNP
ncbi:hypothetical protein L3C95_29045 [Chitinophaga filiformis]|uniref:hypothetical protein n=1 Tax=Chitinophaga filiformis TaxID=104663 RepID=UPI001F1CA227|nr:hypothetical protein [Chitinophaga filiformis]MCF6406982.1 hypothetical protein [Chitinophaga filiformis]